MQYSLDAMETALRVLSAITYRRDPDPRDVWALRAMAAIDAKRMPADELACEVIQQALRHRAEVRAASR